MMNDNTTNERLQITINLKRMAAINSDHNYIYKNVYVIDWTLFDLLNSAFFMLPSCIYPFFSHSGMKPLSSSVEACHWEGTGQTSATMISVSQDPRRWIIFIGCWSTTTILGLRWLATRLSSCSKSFSRPMLLKTSKDGMGQRTLKTMVTCTGTTRSF